MGHVSAAALPVIDLASPDIGATTKSIRQALVDYGFFYVINHGIDGAQMKSVYGESKNFFEQTMEEKMALQKNSSHRGYIPPDFEGFEADAGGKGDLLECFHIGSGESKNDGNQWPPAERFPSWKDTMKSYYECAMGTSKRILSLIALSLDLDAEFFKPDGSETILRPIHYSGRAIQSIHGSDHGANAHTDYGMLTLLSTDGTPGLQICRDKDARPQLWEDVHHIEGRSRVACSSSRVDVSPGCLSILYSLLCSALLLLAAQVYPTSCFDGWQGAIFSRFLCLAKPRYDGYVHRKLLQRDKSPKIPAY